MNLKQKYAYQAMFRNGIGGIRLIHNEAIGNFIKLNQQTAGSTVFQGTLYEYTTMRELNEKLCIDELEKIGGAHDGGVDITGYWPINKIREAMKDIIGIPDEDIPKRCTVNGARVVPLVNKMINDEPFEPIKVLVQCKAFKSSKVTPKELRELVGTYTSMVPASPKNKNNTIMMMCSPHLLTKDGLKLINNIRIPLIYLRIEMLKSLHVGDYDLHTSGKIINYYENEYAYKLLQGCGVSEWLKLNKYKSDK